MIIYPSKKLQPGLSQEWFRESAQPGTKLTIRGYNTKELCQIYGFSYKVMRKKLAPIKRRIGKRRGYYYNPHQVEIIVLHLGPPYVLVDDAA